jgi:hypothetical protein
VGAYYQSATRNLTMVVLCVLAAGFFSWRYVAEDGSFFELIMMSASIAGALHGGWGFIQKEPAISFDREGVRLRRWCGVADIPWRDVHGVTTKVVTIRGTEIKWLSVACEGGLMGSRSVNVSLSSLDIAAGNEEMVAAAVYQAWVAAMGESAVAMAGAGHKGWGANFYDSAEPANRFDADAAFARYQAKQGLDQPEYGTPSIPATPSVAPSPASSAPPRPVFGRKAV